MMWAHNLLAAMISMDMNLAGGKLKTTFTDNTTTCNNNVKTTTNTIERKKEQMCTGPVTNQKGFVLYPDYKEKDIITN